MDLSPTEGSVSRQSNGCGVGSFGRYAEVGRQKQLHTYVARVVAAFVLVGRGNTMVLVRIY